MRRSLTYILLITGILLSTSSCSVVDWESVGNVINAFSLWRAVSFAMENWEGIGCLGIVAGLANSFKHLHKIKFKWLARGVAVGIVFGMLIASGLFYAQYHEPIKETVIIIIES